MFNVFGLLSFIGGYILILIVISSFAGQLPVDLQLSRLIVHGISLGIGAEAVALASALSQPKSVFRLASTLIHKVVIWVDLCKYL